jgi:hypothetical protein
MKMSEVKKEGKQERGRREADTNRRKEIEYRDRWKDKKRKDSE